MMVHVLVLLAMCWYLTVKSVYRFLMSPITLSQLRHEIAIEHGLTHLGLLLGLSELLALIDAEAAHTRLVEHLLLVHLLVDIWQHLVDSRVIGRLQHAGLSRVHLVYAQWSISLGVAASTLFPHSLSHKEGLIGFLCTQHSVHPLSR